MAEFFSSRLLRLLIAPYRSRMVNMASRPFYQVADRVLGSQFLEDIAEFFILFQTMYAGLRRAGPGGRAAAARPAHHFRGGEHAGGGAGAGGRVLHPGADGQEASISVPWCSTGCCPTTCSTRPPSGRAARLCDDAAELAQLDGLAELARHGRGPAGPGAGRDGGELPQLRRRGPPRGRPSASELEVRPDVVATVPEFDARHPRPARSAPPRRADLGVRRG